MSLVVVTPPTTYAVTVAEVLSHLRLDAGETDYISGVIIPGAQAMVEELTGRRLSTTVLRLGLDGWPDDDEILLPGPPVASITSITYLDENNVRQTLAASCYTLDADPAPAVLAPAYGLSWPTALQVAGSIKITYPAGYASPAAVPASLRAAVLLACGHKYEHRELAIVGTIIYEIPAGLEAVCAPHDIRDRFA